MKNLYIAFVFAAVCAAPVVASAQDALPDQFPLYAYVEPDTDLVVLRAKKLQMPTDDNWEELDFTERPDEAGFETVEWLPSGFGLRRYIFEQAPVIGNAGGITVREGGISGIMYRDGVFLMLSDRGPNADAIAHPAAKGQTALIFPFPNYSQKIWQTRPSNGRLVVEKVTTIKKPDGKPTGGLPLPIGQGHTGETPWADDKPTVLSPDPWGLDAEGIVQDANGNYWVCDEYATCIWQLDPTGRVKTRYTPFPSLPQDRPLDPALGKRRPNRGFEGIAITPGGLIYTILQSPADNPDAQAGNTSRLHRLVELNPATGAVRTFVYEHAPEQGQVKNRDWKIGDLSAINDNEFLVVEHAMRQTTNIKNVYKISLAGATPLKGELYDGKTLEQLVDARTAAAYGIRPVNKELFADLYDLGWDPSHDKPEGIAIIDERTFAVINDNDFGIETPKADGQIVESGKQTCLYMYNIPEDKKLNYVKLRSKVSEQEKLFAARGGAVKGNDAGILESALVYRNPATGVYKAILPQELSQAYHAQLVNAEGKVVFNANNLSGTEQQFNWKDLPRGAYTLRLRCAGAAGTYKVSLD